MLLLAGAGVSNTRQASAAGVTLTLQNFAFNAATNTVTWDYVFTSTEAAGVSATVQDYGPVVTITGTTPANE